MSKSPPSRINGSASSPLKKDKIWTVEAICNHKVIDGQNHYLVKWENYPIEQNSWEPENDLTDYKQAIDDWKQESDGKRKKACDFVVEKIVDERDDHGIKLFLVKWKDYDESQNTWEPIDNLQRCQKLLNKWKRAKKVQVKSKAPKSETSSAENGEYIVEKICAEITENGQTSYHIKWKNYPYTENTWEPLENLAGSKALLDSWNAENAKMSVKPVLISDESSSNSDEPEEEAVEIELKSDGNVNVRQITPVLEASASESEEEAEFIVEEVLKEKIIGDATFYKVKWRDYPESACTWEPAENLDKCGPVLERFRAGQQ